MSEHRLAVLREAQMTVDALSETGLIGTSEMLLARMSDDRTATLLIETAGERRLPTREEVAALRDVAAVLPRVLRELEAFVTGHRRCSCCGYERPVTYDKRCATCKEHCDQPYDPHTYQQHGDVWQAQLKKTGR